MLQIPKATKSLVVQGGINRIRDGRAPTDRSKKSIRLRAKGENTSHERETVVRAFKHLQYKNISNTVVNGCLYSLWTTLIHFRLVLLT